VRMNTAVISSSHTRCGPVAVYHRRATVHR
jgi:hypothetical protein